MAEKQEEPMQAPVAGSDQEAEIVDKIVSQHIRSMYQVISKLSLNYVTASMGIASKMSAEIVSIPLVASLQLSEDPMEQYQLAETTVKMVMWCMQQAGDSLIRRGVPPDLVEKVFHLDRPRIQV
jgi:hypothetical protein